MMAESCERGLCVLRLLVVIAASVLSRVAHGQPRTVEHAELGFRVTIPEGFETDSAIVSRDPEYLFGFRRVVDEGEIGQVIVIQRMGGTIGRERLGAKQLGGFTGRLVLVPWKSFQIEMFEVIEKAGELEMVTYNVQVPLKPEAVQVTVAGLAKDQTETRATVDSLLRSLDGQSNWIPSVFPASISGGPGYSTVLLVASAVLALPVLVVVGMASRRRSLGAALLTCLALFICGFACRHFESREGRMASGGLRLTAVAGVVVALVSRIGARPRRVGGGSNAG